MGWREAVRGAALLVRDQPALIAVGLLGFLARGGLVAFLLPILALPTPIGISTFIGGTALTGAGASDGLIRLIVAGVVLVVSFVLAGAALGAVADVLLGREAIALALARERRAADGVEPSVADGLDRGDIDDPSQLAVRQTLRIGRSIVGQVFLIRVLTLAPVALAVAWGTARLVAAGYHQLILPDDLTVPLGLRILFEALDAAVVVVAVWLASEWIGGIAVRQVVVGGRSVAMAFVEAFAGILRRPLTSVATYALGVGALAVTAGPTLLIAAIMWSRLQALLADDVTILLLVPATLVFVLAWGGGLLAVGAVVAWRSILGDLDVLRAVQSRSASSPVRFSESTTIAMRTPGHALEDG
jgi:hypothetical protein